MLNSPGSQQSLFRIMPLYNSCPHLLIFLLTLIACFYGGYASDTSLKERADRVRGLEKPLHDTTTAPITIQSERDPSQKSDARYKLPSWFNYDQFKRFFGKRYPIPEDNETHKRIYIRTALKVFEKRALYRTNRTDILPSINELSDMTTSELLALRRNPQGTRQGSKQKIIDDITCCTYDQVHRRIIGLLDRTSGVEETDLALSRAYVDELQQKPIPGVESEQAKTAEGETSELGHKSVMEAVASSFGTKDGSDLKSLREDSSIVAPTRTPTLLIVKATPTMTPSVVTPRSSHHSSLPMATESGPIKSIKETQESGNSPVMVGEASDFERAIEESVRQQIELQLSPSTSHGRQLTERLSSYFGQPVKLTATIGRPLVSTTRVSTKSPSMFQ